MAVPDPTDPYTAWRALAPELRYERPPDLQGVRVQNAVNANADHVHIAGHLRADQAYIVETCVDACLALVGAHVDRSVHLQRIGVQGLFNLSVVEIEIALDMRSLKGYCARHRRLSRLFRVGTKYDGSPTFRPYAFKTPSTRTPTMSKSSTDLCANQAYIVEG